MSKEALKRLKREVLWWGTIMKFNCFTYSQKCSVFLRYFFHNCQEFFFFCVQKTYFIFIKQKAYCAWSFRFCRTYISISETVKLILHSVVVIVLLLHSVIDYQRTESLYLMAALQAMSPAILATLINVTILPAGNSTPWQCWHYRFCWFDGEHP